MPEKALFIQEDEMAKELAVRFGLFNLFKAAGGTNWVQMYPYKGHPTHWVFVGRFDGFADPRDNGWSAWFFPKSAETFEQAEAQIRKDFVPGTGNIP